MIQVEILEEETYYALEKKINEKLKEFFERKYAVKDIKYNGSGNHAYSINKYSTMIIYESDYEYYK